MLEHDEVAVVAACSDADSTVAVGRRVDRLALVGRDVEALVEARLAGERIAAAAERAASASRAPARSTASRRPAPRAARRRGARSAAGSRAPAAGRAARRTCPRATTSDVVTHARRSRRSAAAVPPAARAFTTAGSFCHRARLRRIERGARAEVVDDAFERLNLRGQLAGRRAVAAVLDLEQRVGGAELLDLGAGAPLGAKADQNRQHQHAATPAGPWRGD